MSKPVLGRKLGTLLKEEAGKDVNPTLLRGPRPEAAQGKPPPRASVPPWYWLGADLLLVTFALLILYKSPAPLPATKRAVAVVAVVLGGGLALWALRPTAGK